MTPVYLTSTYVQDGPASTRATSTRARRTRPATRSRPTSRRSRAARHGLAFASGLAATDACSTCSTPATTSSPPTTFYGGTFRIFDKVFRGSGSSSTYVDLSDRGTSSAAIRRETKLVWVETPTNPMLKIVDLAAVAEIAQAHGARPSVDNTFVTPYFQRPLELGADVVVHSTTKYLNGHSDVVGGAVVTSDDELARGSRSCRTRSAACRRRWTASWCCAAQDAARAHGAARARTRSRRAASRRTRRSSGSSTPACRRTRSTRSRAGR